MASGKLALRLCLFCVCAGLVSCGRSSLGARSINLGSGEDSGSREDSAPAPTADAASVRDALVTADAASGEDALVIPKADTQLPTCGNGILDPGEDCDDGNTQSGDGCSKLCKLECGYTCNCGDPTKLCIYLVVCGDGIRSSSEACDDGNTNSGDGCSANCQVEAHWQCHVPGRRCTPTCGDGILLGTETCDDGNTVAGDGCGENCLIEGAGQYCGDGVISGAEECDDGAFNNDAEYGACTTKCRYSFCGDGIVNGSEECDLGNDRNGAVYGDPQGCTIGCTRPHYCGDGFVDSDYGEMCDLGPGGNGTPGSYCSPNCIIYIVD